MLARHRVGERGEGGGPGLLRHQDLELAPQHAQALTNLAAIHDVRGETTLAREALKRALELDPGEAKAREHLADLDGRA